MFSVIIIRFLTLQVREGWWKLWSSLKLAKSEKCNILMRENKSDTRSLITDLVNYINYIAFNWIESVSHICIYNWNGLHRRRSVGYHLINDNSDIESRTRTIFKYILKCHNWQGPLFLEYFFSIYWLIT